MWSILMSLFSNTIELRSFQMLHMLFKARSGSNKTAVSKAYEKGPKGMDNRVGEE